MEWFLKARDNAAIPSKGSVKYWIHAASLGEYEMAIPIIEKLLEKNRLDAILITVFSPSGYTQAIKGPYANRIMYLPLDTLRKVSCFYKDYTPQKAIFIRYDFWYNYIDEGLKNGMEFYVVNGRFTSNHFFFKWYGKPYLVLLSRFVRVFTSDVASAHLLVQHKVNASYSGDTRFDRVNDITLRAKQENKIAEYKGDRKLLILGSSWEEEEDVLFALLQTNPNNLAVIIAPHDLKRVPNIVRKLAEFSPKKYTDDSFSKKDKVLILDTMGMLSSMYQYADFALIGGGFSGALHNVLEPAIWGCHISFGPQIDKFPEAQELVQKELAFCIASHKAWIDKVTELLAENEKLTLISQQTKYHCSSQLGATAKALLAIG